MDGGTLPTWAVYTAALLASAAILMVLLASHRKKRPPPPPGPRPWPIVGSLHLIGELPHRSIHELSRKYGPIMQLYLGSQRVVVGSSVEMAREFLKTQDLVFASRPRTAAGKYTTYNYSDIAWAPYGPYWRQARKLCLTELFSAKRLDSYEYIRLEETQRMLARLAGATTGGAAVLLKDHLNLLSLSVISRMVLGRTYTGEEAATDVVSPEEFKKMLDELFLLNGVLNIGDMIPWLDFLDLQGYVRRMKALSVKFDAFLDRVLEEHEDRRGRAGPEFVPADMVDVLLQLADDPNLSVKLTRDGVKGFIQSSAVTVEWAMAEILRRPEIFEKAWEELDRVVGRERWVEEKDIPNLPFIETVVKETMRLHRREDTTVAGYHVPAGTEVLVNVWTIGRDPAVWDSPEEFRPESCCRSGGEEDVPGYQLGLKMVQSSLANLLHGFRWRLPEGAAPEDLNMEELFGLTTPKKIPLEVVAELRLASQVYSL
ncbi:unnamed protein product [Spirodela intermedia]|uniref:Uncharacterized protein n=1 Tax=Spirodela intermedia TaxID=51605 RepID=A0A7I8IN60_SPIIN|nr:unnamed protein product [Spirodela intermedia]CAA6659317.1 unnamed protein product [Spirodela intermedia]